MKMSWEEGGRGVEGYFLTKCGVEQQGIEWEKKNFLFKEYKTISYKEKQTISTLLQRIIKNIKFMNKALLFIL